MPRAATQGGRGAANLLKRASRDIKEIELRNPYELRIKPFIGSDYTIELLGKGIDSNEYRRLVNNITTARVRRCVLAKIAPAFKDEEVLKEFLADWRIEFIPSDTSSPPAARTRI